MVTHLDYAIGRQVAKHLIHNIMQLSVRSVFDGGPAKRGGVHITRIRIRSQL